MGWAQRHIERLGNGETFEFRPRGNSMKGLIRSGQLVRVEPAKSLAVGDIVLCRVRGSEYLHLIKAIQDERYLIGNNIGRINGWTHRSNIFGVLVETLD